MSEIFDLDIDKVFQLDEFVEHARQNIDVYDRESVLENAWALRALANNRHFVLDAYHSELSAIVSNTSANGNQPQSLALHIERDFYVRANIWLPIEVGKRTEKFEKKLYAYDLPHDHNFDFLTVGYFGSGYKTDIYTYDHSLCEGVLGERVHVKYQGEYQLRPGRVISFFGGQDIHVQYVPEEISVSLNFLCHNPQAAWQQQYIFDLENSKLIGGAGDVLSNRLYLVECAGLFGNNETAEILTDLLDKFPCNKTKALALASIARISPEQAERAYKLATADVVRLSEARLITGNFARAHTGG